MNKKTLGQLKIAYAKVMSIPPVQMASDKYKENKKAKSIKKYKDHLSRLYCDFKSWNMEMTTFCRVDLGQGKEDSEFVGFDIWGYLDKAGREALSANAPKDFGLPNGDEIAFGLAITDTDALENLKKPEMSGLYFLSDSQSYIFNVNGFSVGAVGFSVDEAMISDEGKIKIPRQALINLAYAKENCDYIIVYVLNKCPAGCEKVLMRSLGNLGADYVFATDMNSTNVGTPVRRMDGNYVYGCTSVGRFPSENTDSAVVLRHKIMIKTMGNKMGEDFLINRSFYPMVNGKVSTYANCKDATDKLEAYKEIIEGCRGYRHFEDPLTIGDICKIIDVQLPERYSYMENVSVGKVTTHWPDSEKGDVMFFHEPYKDVNDVIEKPLKVRLLVVEKALEKGITFVFSHVPLDPSIPHVVVPGAMEAHIKLCAHLRKKYSLKTVGITGSIGKTSTKDMLYNVLKQKYDTDRNLRNTNTQVNIGLHIQNFKEWQEIYIQEIGGGRKGGASRHSRMILPEAACVTNIGDAHIGNHGSREALMINKLGITDGLAPCGILYLNGDDPLLSKAQVSVPVVYYALHNEKADYYASDISTDGEHMDFNICHGETKVPVHLNVPGEHNALNAVCCFAIAKQFGLSDEEIQVGLAEFRTSGVRQNFVVVNGYRLFVDCFNASPDSIDSSLSVLDSAAAGKGKKIAVIGDVTGAAGMAKDVHRKIGQMVINHKPDVLLCYGKNSKEVYKIAKAAGFNAYSFTKPTELTSFLKKNMNKEDVILFKGSSKMKLAQIIDDIFGTMFSEQMFADSAKSKKYTEKGIDYIVCPAFATVKGCSSLAKKISLPDKIKGKALRNIDQEAFKGNAFLKEIHLCSKVRHIGDYAFADCHKLTDVYLPDNLKYLGEGVFQGCQNLTLHCKEGSQAEALCKSMGLLHKKM